MIFGVFLGALALSALACSVVLFLSARNRTVPGAKPLFVLALAELWWVVTYAGELAADGLQATALLAKAEWVGVVVIPVAWAAFVIEYTGRKEYLTRTTLGALLLVPVTSVLAALFSYDPLIRTDLGLATVGSGSALTGDFGPMIWVFALYTWLLVATSAILLVEFVVEKRTLYRARAASLLGAAVVPVAASFAFATDLVGPLVLDPTPVAFVISSLFAVVAIVEFDLFSRAPVSSHIAAVTAVNAIADPLFVLDSDRKVVDANPAALDLVGATSASILDSHAREVLPLEDLAALADGRTTVTVPGEPHDAYYEVQAASIDDGADNDFGEVVTFREVTERHRREERLDTLNDVLRATLQEEMQTVKRVTETSDDEPSAFLTLRESAATALDVTKRAAELSDLVSTGEEAPADIVPIIHDEMDEARTRYPEVAFVLDATLDEWAYCSGLFEPVFRVALRNAAQRAMAGGADPVVSVSVDVDDDPSGEVRIVVSDEGDPLTDHERLVLTEGLEPRPADSEDIGRWLVNWGMRHCDGTATVVREAGWTRLQLTFPQTPDEQ